MPVMTIAGAVTIRMLRLSKCSCTTGLCFVWQTRPHLRPYMRFLFVRPEFCPLGDLSTPKVRLSSDSASRQTPLPLAKFFPLLGDFGTFTLENVRSPGAPGKVPWNLIIPGHLERGTKPRKSLGLLPMVKSLSVIYECCLSKIAGRRGFLPVIRDFLIIEQAKSFQPFGRVLDGEYLAKMRVQDSAEAPRCF